MYSHNRAILAGLFYLQLRAKLTRLPATTEIRKHSYVSVPINWCLFSLSTRSQIPSDELAGAFVTTTEASSEDLQVASNQVKRN